jgi:hypothetical protein
VLCHSLVKIDLVFTGKQCVELTDIVHHKTMRVAGYDEIMIQCRILLLYGERSACHTGNAGNPMRTATIGLKSSPGSKVKFAVIHMGDVVCF